jgi:lipopolysaccharide/colanic/teichoic acid biosynthesis glycosyltransferase
MSTDIGGIRFIRIRGGKIGRAALLTRRFLDVALATLAFIIVFLPGLLIVGPIIVLTSSGGVFFSTTVVGKHGQRFTWRKFRSMRLARPGEDESRRQIVAAAIRSSTAESTSGSTKVVDSDRVTKIGKVLRKTSLDELPQLLNVISGSMALVGPRPCLPFEYDEYSEWQRHRLDFKPGITGVWQVYGRSRVQFDEMVFMDICGQLNRSFLDDLKLMISTIPVALFGRGAE